jgi:hypothetical protein
MKRLLLLTLDEIDYETVVEAMAKREREAEFPNSRSCINGATLAEICRGWMELVECFKMEMEDEDDDGEGWKNT